MKFTRQAIAALTMPKGKREHFEWDDDLPGFGVRLRAGVGLSLTWVIQYRISEKQRRESLGDIRKVSLEDARKIAKQRFAQVQLGEDPAAKRAEEAAQKLRLGAVADRYLDIKQDTLRPTSFRAAERYLRKHWKGLHGMPIGTVKRADVAAILQEITARHGRVSASRARSNLSALFGWAMREGLCDANPVIATNDPARGVPARDRVLSDAEIQTIWGACLDDNFGAIVKLLLLCGCRREEIGGLRWSEIDLDTSILTITGERTKNHKTLVLTLAPAAIKILKSVPRRDGQEFVFGKQGRTGFNAWSYCTIALNNRIAAATDRPLPHWTLHDLRRSMRSGLGRMGVAPHIAEMTIGHAQAGIQAVYDRYRYEAEIGAALARWAEHVLALVEGRQSKVVTLQRA